MTDSENRLNDGVIIPHLPVRRILLVEPQETQRMTTVVEGIVGV